MTTPPISGSKILGLECASALSSPIGAVRTDLTKEGAKSALLNAKQVHESKIHGGVSLAGSRYTSSHRRMIKFDTSL